MLKQKLDRENSILTLEPEGKLTEDDFDKVSKDIDPYIEESGGLKALIIVTPSFPKWENADALLRHLKFIKDHHEKIEKIAFVTDSIAGDFAEKITSHFVSAEIKSFPYDSLEKAKEWISQ
ncbi:Conserved protein [hydrothermal vent metagenome]|uniref:Conserved protein n=1 Tax=hydrothermal vent metagenome TaxID=652676 RepID=A0A1W1BRP3_9ZZZZ